MAGDGDRSLPWWDGHQRQRYSTNNRDQCMASVQRERKTGNMTDKPHVDVASIWHSRADDLAAWTTRRLVNRRDAWGGYRPDTEIGREFRRQDGTTGKLGAQKTVRGKLTQALLVRHFQPRSR